MTQDNGSAGQDIRDLLTRAEAAATRAEKAAYQAISHFDKDIAEHVRAELQRADRAVDAALGRLIRSKWTGLLVLVALLGVFFAGAAADTAFNISTSADDVLRAVENFAIDAQEVVIDKAQDVVDIEKAAVGER